MPKTLNAEEQRKRRGIGIGHRRPATAEQDQSPKPNSTKIRQKQDREESWRIGRVISDAEVVPNSAEIDLIILCVR
jgi:hypothetical protein